MGQGRDGMICDYLQETLSITIRMELFDIEAESVFEELRNDRGSAEDFNQCVYAAWGRFTGSHNTVFILYPVGQTLFPLFLSSNLEERLSKTSSLLLDISKTSSFEESNYFSLT